MNTIDLYLRKIISCALFISLTGSPVAIPATEPVALAVERQNVVSETTPLPKTWRERREAKLREVRIRRERSKDASESRKFLKETNARRSRVGRKILSKGAWLRKTTRHFSIFGQAADAELMDQLTRNVEDMYDNISYTFGELVRPGWPHRAEIVLLRDKAFWKTTKYTHALHTESFSIPHLINSKSTLMHRPRPTFKVPSGIISPI